ncbi:ATP synthase F1 subunit delta [Blattabacterium cuenoti]|uniref:ATP synthase F1 subunit delta n=1 Tax=Blattabacterium cuenoti TaxID=1653831 RepID=UPI00163BC6CD|nr:ATP synthase F1 subunit delta [Blattabacterium cuenoti]
MFSNKKIIKHYARVFFEYSIMNDNDLFYHKVKKVFSLLYQNVDLSKILYTPLLSSNKKIIIFKKILYHFDASLFQFVKLLIIRKRESLLKEIFLEYLEIYKEEKKGLIKCLVVSAFPLNTDMQKIITHKIKMFPNYHKNKIHIINKIDPSIIGGVLFRIGYKEWNFSVQEQLFCIKKFLKNF